RRPDEHRAEPGARDEAGACRGERELARDRREQERDEDHVHRVEEPSDAADEEKTPVERVQGDAVETSDERLLAQMRPSAESSSALRIDAPAAPRMVLCPSTTYL